MYGGFPTYLSVVLCAVLLPIAACNRGGTPTSPAPPSASKASLTAEPVVVTPDFFGRSVCPTQPPFDVRVTVLVGGADLIVRGFRFGFTDRFGNATIPDVFFIPASSEPALAGGPVPMPTPGMSTIPNSSPIPIPGSSPVSGVLLSDRSRLSLPLLLRFPCGVFPEGTILVTGDLLDRNGTPEKPHLRIAVRK